MPESSEQQPTTPHHPAPPPIAAEPKEMAEPVMVRTLTDTVQPTNEKVTADIEAAKLMTEGQRNTSWKWEETQALLALMAGRSSVYSAVTLALSPLAYGAFRPDLAIALIPLADKAFLFLVTTATGITAYYFLRTNTHKIGGVQRGDTGR